PRIVDREAVERRAGDDAHTDAKWSGAIRRSGTHHQRHHAQVSGLRLGTTDEFCAVGLRVANAALQTKVQPLAIAVLREPQAILRDDGRALAAERAVPVLGESDSRAE